VRSLSACYFKVKFQDQVFDEIEKNEKFTSFKFSLNVSNMENKKLTFTVHELHLLIWKESISKIAKRTKLNETVIRKKCKELGIPTPTSAYWSQLKFNKYVQIIALPQGIDPKRTITFEIKPPKKTTRTKKVIKVGEMTDFHPLVKQAKNEFIRQQNRKQSNRWDYQEERIPILSIHVSPEHIDRALSIYDAVIKQLFQRGYSVEVTQHRTIAIVQGIRIPLRLREKDKRVLKTDRKNTWDQYDYIATGNLVFVIELRAWRRKEYYDTEYVKLEEKTDKIVENIIKQGVEERDLEIQSEINRKLEEERKQSELERKKRTNAELEKFNAILIQQNRWHQAQIMRDYLNQYENYFQNLNQLDEQKKEWLDWARKKADWYDPFIELNDVIMERIDRDKLEPIPLKDGWW
jgi:hypothetical protein